MSDTPDTPVLNVNSPLLRLDIPPVAIVLLCFGGYLTFFSVIFFIRFLLKSKGTCPEDCCNCENLDCCQCLEACADICTCGTPTVTKCLDACCPKRQLDCVNIILCQCCGTPQNPCCGNSSIPCCTYGDLNCNCACIQPDLDSVNCLCCQIGTSNYNRAADLD